MNRNAITLLLLGALLMGLTGATPPQDRAPIVVEVDVLVYGGTSGGVMAAYTARKYGKRVLLVEPGRHLGGMTSGGLGQTDIGNKFAVSGLALDFYRRLGTYYGRFEAWQFEPRVAEQVFEQYADEAELEILFSRRLKAVQKKGTEIQSVTLEFAGKGTSLADVEVRARVFIDATYEGDLMARAGASYTVGREANSVYGETIDGVQLMTGHQFPDGVDPYRIPGKPESGLLPEINDGKLEPNGTGDARVQAYNFRMALCRDDARRLEITRPDNYDPGRYELLLRLIEARKWKTIYDGFIISGMPNGKTDWNNKGGFSTDYIGKNWDYPEADYAGRARIWKEHEDYQKGLLYFVANDPRVPDSLRAQMQQWGYCRDEFLDTDGWPHQLYVREARRLVGEYVMTEANSRGKVTVDDAVGMAAYTMDSHNIQRVVVQGPNGPMVKNEGNVEVGGFPPYPISYRSITPKRTEVTNLLVPIALSASHIAYGSIRMEPVFMVLSQSAAVAAVMAIDGGVPVQKVDVMALQKELRANPLADGSIPEVLVDDKLVGRVERRGDWREVKAQGQHGLSTLMLASGAKGSARFYFDVVTSGRYKVYANWPRNKELATSVPVTVSYAGGLDRKALNMRDPGTVGDSGVQHGIASWVLVGEYEFRKDGASYLEISAPGTDGFVYADAVLFVPTSAR